MTPDRYAAVFSEIKGLLDPLPISVPKSLLAILLFESDEKAFEIVAAADPRAAELVRSIVAQNEASLKDPAEFRLAIRHRNHAKSIAAKVVRTKGLNKSFGWALDEWLIHPFWGWLVLAAVVYVGFYQFVGVLGGKIAVDFLDNTLFLGHINPFFIGLFERWVHWAPIRQLFVGDYGVITLGVRYAVSLILPIVTFFFFSFSIAEDTGYLPRLAMMLDNSFKRIGLSGRAVIPMVIGFGCVTMATLVARTLPTKRERIIATILLSLAIPCSAQLGVILALLSVYPKALFLWAVTMLIIFVTSGTILSRMMPGQTPSFYMELPPLRWPKPANILLKTWTRLRWYFWEVFPLFLFASVLIWIGQITGLFGIITHALSVPLDSVGLPEVSAPAFLFGFFRRDYGAAGLFDLAKHGLLDAEQLFISCLMLTLFLPCIAQFLINLKERGWKLGVSISVFTLVFSYGCAWAAHRLALASGFFQ